MRNAGIDLSEEKHSKAQYRVHIHFNISTATTLRICAVNHVLKYATDSTISYPETSGSLASGWSPGETLENSKKFKVFDWLFCISSVTASIVLPQKSCGNKIPVPQSLSWRLNADQKA